jgi:hypothetical protein
MTGTQILANAFFGFWYVLGNHFIAILNLCLLVGIVYFLYYFIIKRSS